MQANPWMIFAVIGVGSFLGPLSGSITNVALPTIGKHFAADVQSVKWVVLVYLVINTFLLPMAGRWAQRYGASRLYTMGFALFTLGSGLCAASAEMGFYALVGARIVQAGGSALLFATAGTLVARYIPAQRRGLAFGMVGSIVAIALITGPVLGGLICAHYSWPWIFWLQLPIAALGLLSSILLLPPEEVSLAATFPTLSAAAWVVLVAGISLIGEAFSKGLWDEYLYLSIPTTLLALLLFIATERTGQGLFDYSMLRIPAFAMSAGGALMLNMIFFTLLLFLPFYLEDYLGVSLERIGLILGISPLASFISGPASGHVADRIGYRTPIVLGLLFTTAGFGALALAIQSASIPWVALSSGLLGFGSGMFGGPNFAAMMSSVAVQQRPLASSAGSLTRNLGFMLGTSFGSIGMGLLLSHYGGVELMLAARTHVLSPAVVPADAFSYAFTWLVLSCAAVSLLGLFASLRFPNRIPHAEPVPQMEL